MTKNWKIPAFFAFVFLCGMMTMMVPIVLVDHESFIVTGFSLIQSIFLAVMIEISGIVAAFVGLKYMLFNWQSVLEHYAKDDAAS